MLGKITHINFLIMFERFLQNTIRETYITKWDENSITQEIAKGFATEFKNLEVTNSYPTPSKIKSLAYRNKGGQNSDEHYFGDLGFLVKIEYPDNSCLEGVSFLEAKRTYPDNGETSTNLFKTIDIPQLERIYQHAPYSYLLLYDHRPIVKTNFSDYLNSNSIYHMQSDYNSFRNIPYEFKSVVVPINIAKKLQIRTRELYNFSHLFSEQVVNRYFLGFDLNFDENLIKMAKGYESDINGRINYLITTSISYKSFENESFKPELPEINTEIYSPLSSNEN